MEKPTKQSTNIEESLHGANADIDEVNKTVKQPYKYKSKYKSQDYKKTYKHSHSKEKTCARCGKKGHLSHNCKCTQGKKCLKCGKLGHFVKCCKTKVKSNQQSVNEVRNNSSNDESDEEVYLLSMKHKSADKRYLINIGSKEINILIDSGSTLNILLNEKTYKTFNPGSVV